jgi:hemin uptake protein HemP
MQNRSIEMNAAEDKEDTENNDERKPVSASNARQLTVIDNCVESRDLFVDTRSIVILHGPDAYQLRLTAQNKLILTK